MKKLVVMFFCFLVSSVFASSYELGKEKSVVCAVCHGEKGISVNPLWPHLAGQHQAYLIKQLSDFKKDTLRHSPVMLPFVAMLTAEEIDAIAYYYAKQPRSIKNKGELSVLGEQIYRSGNLKKQITACIACHGPSGLGNPLAGFPVLSGQQEEYVFLQLEAFKNKTRKNDLNGIMQIIAARMSEEEMRAVSQYLSRLDENT